MNIRVLFRKELREIFRTYRIYVIPVVFLLFGLTSPIIANLLPELLGNMMGEFQIVLPTPTWIDAFDQFFKNLTQIGLLTVIITMMGTVADEKGTGSLLMVLARPVSRNAVVLSKFLANTLLLTASIIISYAACLYNTWVLFPDVPFGSTLTAVVLFWTYAFFIGSVTIFGSCLVRNNIGAGGIGITAFFITAILPSLHSSFARFSPGALTSFSGQVLRTGILTSEMKWAVLITVLLAVSLVGLGSYIFSRQEL